MNPTELNLAIPYPGLRPFFEADHLLFFGRNEQAHELLICLEDSAFVAVVGSSGSGKSSLVRAGLLPLLRDGFLFGTDDWKIAVVRPGHEPYQQLARQLVGQVSNRSESQDDDTFGTCPVPPQPDDVLGLLRRSDNGLVEAVNQLWPDSESHVLVVIDQFEELFGFRRADGSARSLQNCASRDEASAFVAMLLAAARKAGQRLRVILTMRSDFVGDCEVFLGLPQAISQSQFLVPRLTRSQMEAAITGPGQIRQAEFQPFDFEPGLVNTLINEAGDRPDQLPLLQHALMRTWKESNRKLLTEADYSQAGRIEKALSNDADNAFNHLDADGQRLARQMFLLLCDVSAEGQITRRRPLAQEVMDVALMDGAQIERVIRVFQADDRNFLLPPSPQPIAPATVLDISHESLLRQWLKLKDWLSEERESAAQYGQLAVNARRNKAGRADLLGKLDLEAASQWFNRVQPTAAWGDRYAPDQFQTVSDFLAASREAEQERLEREQAQRLERERLKEEARQAEARRLKDQVEAAKALAVEQQAKAQSTRRLLRWVSAAALVAAVACVVALYFQSQARDAQEKAETAKTNALIGLKSQLQMFLEPVDIGGMVVVAVNHKSSDEAWKRLDELVANNRAFATTAKINEAIHDLQEATNKWRDENDDGNVRAIQQKVLKLSQAYREAWEEKSSELPQDILTLSREFIYQQTAGPAIRAAHLLADSPSSLPANDEFEKLYWSSLVFFETSRIESAMVRFRWGLERNEPNLRDLAAELERAFKDSLAAPHGAVDER